MTLTRDELATLATSVYGSEWQTRLARERDIAPRTVQRWAAEGVAKPGTAAAIRAYLLSRRIIDLPSPPIDGDERDVVARLLMPAVLDQVMDAGLAVGWRTEELLATMISWCEARGRRL